MSKHPSALRIVAAVFAMMLAPPLVVKPSVWAAQNLVVPDGPKAGQKWSATLTPYIVEPLDALAPESGVNKVSCRKSTQTGFSMLGIAYLAHSMACDPCRMMVVQPTDSALTEFNREKLGEAIDRSPALKRLVRGQTSRSSSGSTTYSKRFPGGSLTLAIATSTADLRSKTVKKVFKDEASEYPSDLDGQGSPHAMIEARYESFLRSGEWKELNVSTPVLKGECFIDEEFERGDQRYWHVACPGCGDPVRFVFDRKHFRFSDTYPYEAHYVTPCCGTVIEGHQKYALVEQSPHGWIAIAPGPGKHRSYHFDALTSPFVPWDKIAERFVLAGDDPSKLKAFYNLTLGLAYEMKGDAPDHQRLMERREDHLRGTIPPWGLLLTAAADVQLRGIYVEVLAIGADRRSMVVEAMFIAGETSDPERGAFAELTQIYHRDYADAFGKRRRVDLFGVDSGYRSNVVYSWVRGRPGAMALKGLDGWSRPALGMATLVDVDFGGHKVKNGATVWGVGTWPLKATLYADLRKSGRSGGAEVDPPGFCHFGTWLDEIYFRQLTSEYLGEEKHRGRTRKVWKVRYGEENHFFDCRVYNMALADFLGLSRLAPEQWAELARERGVPAAEADLLSPAPIALQAASVSQPVKAEAAAVPTAQPEDSGDWLKGRRWKL